MQQYTTTFRAMGCEVNVALETDDDGDALLQQAPRVLETIEAALSRFRPHSELSQLNAHPGAWTHASEIMLANIAAAKHAARLTDGLYNPLVLDALVAAGYDRSFENLTNPSRVVPAPRVADWQAIAIKQTQQMVCLPAHLDLGGVAKGWASAMLADGLALYGACAVDIGGDLTLRGCPTLSDGWEVDVANPFDPNANIMTLLLEDTSIVTSGTDYRRWQQDGQPRHHLIDPRTGQPAQTDVVSVTIVHPDAVVAEAYAKAIIMLGSAEGLAWINRQWAGAALVVRSDGTVLANHRFQQYQQ